MDSLALTFLIERWGNISFGFEDMDKNNKSLFKKKYPQPRGPGVRKIRNVA